MTTPAADARSPQGSWEPRIVAFVCKWCTYAGADLAGMSRMKYPANVRIVKLPCSGRIDPLFLLRSFEMGADGILVSGCHPGDCHYISGNYYARRRWILFRELLEAVGVEAGRVHFSWVSAAEGAKFVDVVRTVTGAVRSLGPFRGFAPRESVPGQARNLAASEPEPLIPPAGAEEMRADLAAGTVRSVLGRREGRRSGIAPAFWAATAEDLARIRYAPAGKPLLVTYLVRRLREEPAGVFGVIAGPDEIEAIKRLEAEAQIDPARLRIYKQEEAAVRPKKDETDDPRVPAPASPAGEKWAFWTAEFSKCYRCNACREVCPLCSCVRCVQDKTQPRWIDPSPTPAGNWIWNVTRAFHLAGRCVECGGCEAACPAGIPLMALNRHLARAAERAFAADGSAPSERSPLLSYRAEDEAPFIL